jgi:periplasmic protein TonB
LETAPVTVETAQQTASPSAAAARCGSCGAPSPDSDLCQACQLAFAQFIGGTTPASSGNSMVAADAVELEAPGATTNMASRPPASPEMAPASTGKPEAKLDAAKTEAAKAESARAVAATVVAARIASAKNASEKIGQARQPNPAVVSNGSTASVQSHGWVRSLVLTAALVIVAAAIGLPKVRNSLGIPWPPHAAREGQPDQPTAVAEGLTAEHRVTPPGTRSAPKAARASASSITPEQAATSARSKPTTSAPRKAVRDPTASIGQVVPVSATPTPSPVAAPLQARAAAEPPRSVEATAPIGRFFEPSDVDESPRIATRVEPHLPADIPTRLGDVVVVRVLVSQGGQPFRVSLLRKSRLGRSLDDAVVAAVTQWTFAPARKRGEAVSCWYNIGVPLSRAN